MPKIYFLNQILSKQSLQVFSFFFFFQHVPVLGLNLFAIFSVPAQEKHNHSIKLTQPDFSVGIGVFYVLVF